MSLSRHNSHTSNILQGASSTPVNIVSGKKESLVKTEELLTVNDAKNNSQNAKENTAQTNKLASNSKENPQTSQLVAKKEESLIKTVNTREEYDKLVTTTKDKHILVWFSAVWCGPCKILAMKFQDLAEKYRNKIMILKVDVDDFEDLALENDVSTMPSYMIMLNGVKLAHYFGSKQEHIDEMMEKYLEKTS